MKKLLLILFVLTMLSCGKDGETGPKGDQGEKGEKGDTGIRGADGSTIFSGIIAPNLSIGKPGDFYINTKKGELYGPKTGSGWGNPRSLVGPKGTDGSTMLNGKGIPDAALGKSGDFYLDTEKFILYGPKTSWGWGNGVRLMSDSESRDFLTNFFTFKNLTDESKPYSVTIPKFYYKSKEFTLEKVGDGNLAVFYFCHEAFYEDIYITKDNYRNYEWIKSGVNSNRWYRLSLSYGAQEVTVSHKAVRSGDDIKITFFVEGEMDLESVNNEIAASYVSGIAAHALIKYSPKNVEVISKNKDLVKILDIK